MKVKVVSVNISEKKGTIKQPVPEILINENGIQLDAHAGPSHRQISMLAREAIDRFVEQTGRKTVPGEFAENITVQGMDLMNVSVLDRFVSNEVRLEVTQIGKKCHGTECAIYREVGKCVMPNEGIFCHVLNGGKLKPGDMLTFEPKTLKISVITMSDRASSGEYQDRSGPVIDDLLKTFFSDKRWHPEIDRCILPDDPELLRQKLEQAHGSGYDIIFTTGGTGIGPRDNTPEVVSTFCDKRIPGIMELIRTKYGSLNPNALLSRGVAGMKGTLQIYSLPGSVRAVREYMSEILKTLEHSIYMSHGLDIHQA